MALVSDGFTTTLCVLTKSEQVAITIFPAVLGPLNIMSGLYLNDKSVPIYLQPFKYISFFRYGF